MRIACVVEGTTEYHCVPCLLSRLGHIIIGVMVLNGSYDDWEKTIRHKVLPRVKGMAEKHPDKILVALDREHRASCCPDLAKHAKTIIDEALAEANINCNVGVIISDPKFESTIFADYDSVDSLAILQAGISANFGPTTDGVNVLSHVKAALRDGASYDKVVHGHALAQRLQLQSEAVLAHSRALRKLVKEGS